MSEGEGLGRLWEGGRINGLVVERMSGVLEAGAGGDGMVVDGATAI